MKKFECISDIGSVLVGNKEFGIALSNIGGDGITIFTIYDSDEEYEDDCKQRGVELKFETVIEGKFNVYLYDCSYRDEEDVIATLDGRYGTFKGEMEVAIVKWTDRKRTIFQEVK